MGRFSETLRTDRTRRRKVDNLAVAAAKAADRYGDLNDSDLASAAAGLGPDDAAGALGLAVVAAERFAGLTPRANQILAAAALCSNTIAELATGEGKTLAGVLGAYAQSRAGHGVHVITANDYLARRDALNAAAILSPLGCSVAFIVDESTSDDRRSAYASDITYLTASQCAFDLLRDGTVPYIDQRVHRRSHDQGMYCAIIDEADHVLLDQARTPMILSANVPADESLNDQMAKVVSQLLPGPHFDVDEATSNVAPTPQGIARAEDLLGIDDLYSLENITLAAAFQAHLVAHALLVKDRDYVVADDVVTIVDPATGRLMESHKWSFGIQQAVEAKEGVAYTSGTRAIGTISVPSLFRQYERLAGMTGTAESDADELERIYGLGVTAVAPNTPSVRVDEPDAVYATEKAKLEAVVGVVRAARTKGQPVLVGTASVRTTRRVSKQLTSAGIDHGVLDATRHSDEARIIAQAGRPGAVTVATNMAGRGVDILLGGDPAGLLELSDPTVSDPTHRAAALEELAARCAADGDRVRAAGGLLIVGTERHRSRRIDNQLRGRAGRQGDPGRSLFLLSLEDELITTFAPDALGSLLGRLGDGKTALRSKTVNRAVDGAQEDAELVDAAARLNLINYDEVLDKHRQAGRALRDLLLTDPIGAILAWYPLVARELIRAEGLAAALTPIGDDGTHLAGIEALEAKLDRCFTTDPDDTDTPAKGLAKYLIGRLAAQEALFGDRWPHLVSQLGIRRFDDAWIHHLAELDALQDAVGLRSGANPLATWVADAWKLWEQTTSEIKTDVVTACCRVALVAQADGGLLVDAGK